MDYAYLVFQYVSWFMYLFVRAAIPMRYPGTEQEGEHILFAIEAGGNGHFKQMSLLLDNDQYCPKGSRISVAWDHGVQTCPMFVDDARITSRLHLSSGRLSFGSDGSVSAIQTLLSCSNPVSTLGHFCTLRRMLSFAQETRVTKIINLYHACMGLGSTLQDPGVPIHNIATQYVHFSGSGVLRTDHTLGRLDSFGICLHNRWATASTKKSTTVPIVPRPSEGALVLVQPGTRMFDASDTFVLVYVLDSGLSGRVFDVANMLPHRRFVYFSHTKGTPPKNVTVQRPHPEEFQRCLEQCAVLWTTGGFMLPSEAYQKGIPTIISPTPGHPEQSLNAQYFETFGLLSCGMYGDIASHIEDSLLAYVCPRL